MISLNTMTKIGDLFLSVAQSQQMLENVREVLAKQNYFQPYKLFILIDRQQKGFLDLPDIIDFLDYHSIRTTSGQAQILFNHIDKNQNSQISFNEMQFLSSIYCYLLTKRFSDFILPQQDQILRNGALNNQSSYQIDDDSLSKLELAVARVLQQEITNHRYTKQYQRELFQSQDFDKVVCFSIVDRQNLGYLDYTSIHHFMKEIRLMIRPDEIMLLINRIGDADLERISYEDFIGFLNYESYQKCLPSPSRSNKKQTPLEPHSPIFSRFSPSIYNEYQSPNIQKPVIEDLQYQRFAEWSPISSIQTFKASNNGSIFNYGKQSQKIMKKNNSLENFQTPIQKLNQKLVKDKIVNAPISNFPMKGNEETHLLSLLVQHLQLERKIEEAKIHLTEQRDFNLQDAFRTFDHQANGRVSKVDFELCLNDFGVFPTYEQFNLFWKLIGGPIEGYATFSNFSKAVLPNDEKFRSLLAQRSPFYSQEKIGIENFSYETKVQFRNFIELLIKGNYQIQRNLQGIRKRPLFDIHDAYYSIDADDQGFITARDLSEFLKRKGVFASDQDVDNVLKKFDQSREDRILYKDFVSQLKPKLIEKI